MNKKKLAIGAAVGITALSLLTAGISTSGRRSANREFDQKVAELLEDRCSVINRFKRREEAYPRYLEYIRRNAEEVQQSWRTIIALKKKWRDDFYKQQGTPVGSDDAFLENRMESYWIPAAKKKGIWKDPPEALDAVVKEEFYRSEADCLADRTVVNVKSSRAVGAPFQSKRHKFHELSSKDHCIIWLGKPEEECK